MEHYRDPGMCVHVRVRSIRSTLPKPGGEIERGQARMALARKGAAADSAHRRSSTRKLVTWRGIWPPKTFLRIGRKLSTGDQERLGGWWVN